MRLFVLLLVCTRHDAVLGDTSSWPFFRFLMHRAPGKYAHDCRVLAELVSWEQLVTKHPGRIEINDLRICLPAVNEDEGEDFILSIKNLRIEMNVAWREPRLILKLEIETPTACLVAYDPFLRDTNWRRLGNKLNEELKILHHASTAKPKKNAKSSKSLLGIAGFEVKGKAIGAVVPCDILGGRDATVTVQLDLRQKDKITKKIADAAKLSDHGYITITEAIELIRTELSYKITGALKDALREASQNRNLVSLWPRDWKIQATALLGNKKLTSFSDVQTAAEAVFLQRLSKWTTALFSAFLASRRKQHDSDLK